MGRSIYNTYVGAYIEVNTTSENFKEELDSIDFRDNEYQGKDMPGIMCFDKYMRPYEGLEYMTILIPRPDLGNFCYTTGAEDGHGGDEEATEINSEHLEKMKDDVEKIYKHDIAILGGLFGKEKVKLKAGYIHYVDEVA